MSSTNAIPLPTKPGTLKVDMAQQKPWIKIVWMAWFVDSMSLWAKPPEDRYIRPDREPPNQDHETEILNPNTTVITLPVDGDPGGVGEKMLDEFEEFEDEDCEEEDEGSIGVVVGGVSGGGAAVVRVEDEALKPVAEITWDEANDEVDAAVLKSDGEFGDGDGDGEMDGESTDRCVSYANLSLSLSRH